jgi:GT2 family glycosyltransferase
MERLSIVIVTWNVRDHLEGCLRSLADAGVPDWARVVVVDNASTDGTAAMVERAFPFVELIQSGGNLGYTRGNNLALRRLRSEYVLLLNPDTVVPSGALEALVAEMDRDPRLGTVGPRQHGGDGRVQLEGAVQLPTIWNTCCDLALISRIFPRSRLFARRTMGWWDHCDDRDVPGIPGSAMLLRRAALDQVGLLDETMFCVEDMDLCRRLAHAGWRVRYLGTVGITHFGGASVKRANAGRQRQIAYQSYWLYLRKHDGALTAAVMAASVFAVATIGRIATALLALVPRQSPALRETRLRFAELSRALMAWAVADKLSFHHHLASPPVQDGRPGPAGALPQERVR